MLNKEDFAVIKALNQHGAYLKDIAAELGVHPKTVRRALQRGGVLKKERKRKVSKLEPYKPKIDYLLSEGVWNTVVILREIQADGYSGWVRLRSTVQPGSGVRLGTTGSRTTGAALAALQACIKICINLDCLLVIPISHQ